MSKIRSVLLGSVALMLSHNVFAETAVPSDFSVQIQMCLNGSQCTGNSCATVEATTSNKSRKFGIRGFDAQGQEVLTCGALFTDSYKFSFPLNMPVKFGVFFGSDLVVCDNGGITQVDGNMKIAYTVYDKPNSCAVTKVS